jgi:HlyD family type I secretion membrane fusion protein
MDTITTYLQDVADWLSRTAVPAADTVAANAGMIADRTGVLMDAWLPAWLDRSWLAGAAAAVAVLALVVLIRLRRQRTGALMTGMPLSAHVRGPRRLGLATMAVFFVGLGGLAAMIPLAGAALAPGVVSPDGARKTVQHLEGGIIHRIHVREGDTVEVGQPLLTLEDTQARSSFAELRERIIHLTAVEARLSAEQVDARTLDMPEELLSMGEEAMKAFVGQRELFESRRETRDGRDRIYAQRAVQLREEIEGLRAITVAQDEQIALIQQEITTVEGLIQKKLERTPRLLALQRAVAELQGERAENLTRIARNEQLIGQAELELLTHRQQDNEKVNVELVETRVELAALRSKMPARLDILTRTVIAAPIAGTVMNVRATTESGVVRGGEPLLDIVPRDSGVIIDARVKPVDIDVVYPGMDAKVVLSAYMQRNLPQIQGILRSVSADRLVDDRTGEAYFLAKIEVDEAALRFSGQELELMPGMSADVFILTGERTVLDYLFRPFIASFDRSFRES